MSSAIGVKRDAVEETIPSELNLQAKQKEWVNRMLNLNIERTDEDKTEEEWHGAWKVLIYDSFCQDILSPLFPNVAELRKEGITLHMLIQSQRQPVPGVPAIYFVRPTEENIDRICKDCAAGLYDQVYLNFSSSVPRPLLERLAQFCIGKDCVPRIAKIFDQYAQFVCLEPQLVTFNQPSSYTRIHDPNSPESAVMAYVEEVVESLFCLVVTLGTVPVLRFSNGEAAQLIAERLNDRLVDHLRSRQNLFTESSRSDFAFHRPVLIILDRSIDLTVPLHHSWNYQSLIHDVLGMRANRVQVQDPGKVTQTYDLNAASDEFWRENCAKPFPKVAEAVEVRLKEFKTAYDEINSSGADPDAMLDGTGALSAMIDRVPELRNKKKVLDLHTAIATNLLRHIKRRELDAFFSLEEDCISRAILDKKALVGQLGGGAKGDPDDKLRLLIIYVLTQPDLSDAEISQLEDTVLAAEAEDEKSEEKEGPSAAKAAAGAEARRARFRAVLAYIRKQKLVYKSREQIEQPSSQSGAMRTFGLFETLANKVKQQSVGLLAGVRNLLPVNKDLPVTKIVDALMDNKEGTVADQFPYIDPKLGNKKHKQPHTPFQNAIVFMVGGGNYVEYQNLQEYAEKSSTPQSRKCIAYSATELASPSDFLQQLALLGGHK